MNWLRKWWRAYLTAVRENIAASEKRKRPSWPQTDRHILRINPATGLPMVGLVDAGGNPYGSCVNDQDESTRLGSFGSPDTTTPTFTSHSIDQPYHGSPHQEYGYPPRDWD